MQSVQDKFRGFTLCAIQVGWHRWEAGVIPPAHMVTQPFLKYQLQLQCELLDDPYPSSARAMAAARVVAKLLEHFAITTPGDCNRLDEP
jgi:hypothetical protein